MANKSLGEKSMQLMILVLQNAELKVDWNKVAEAGGYKGSKSAQDSWYSVKKTLMALKNDGDASVSPKKASTPKTPKRKATDAGESSAKKTKSAKNNRKQQNESDDEEVVKKEEDVKDEEAEDFKA